MANMVAKRKEIKESNVLKSWVSSGELRVFRELGSPPWRAAVPDPFFFAFYFLIGTFASVFKHSNSWGTKSQNYRNRFSEFLLLMEGSESGFVQITDPEVPKSEGS
jgi:hypothetical protein